MPPSDDLRDSPALRQEGPQQEEIMWRVDRMIADTAHQMTLGTPLEREFFRGFNAAYHNVRNMLQEALRTAQAPQQEGVDLVARLIDYRAQVLMGFRHISRLDEAELIMEAINGLRPPVAPAEGEP